MQMVAERKLMGERVNTGILVVMLANGRLHIIESVPFSEYQQCKQEDRTLMLGERMYELNEPVVRLKWYDEEALVYGY